MQHAPPVAVHELVEHRYGRSAAWTVGAEEEFMVLDPESMDLSPRAEAVLEHCRAAGHDNVTPEVVQTVVESASPVCSTAAEIEQSLVGSRRALIAGAHAAGCALASAGTHPFSVGPQPVTEGERYAAVAAAYPWITLEAATYGLHVHVGIPSADLAIAVTNSLAAYLPHLLALSGSSPFWRGERTGLQSTRVRLAQLCPRSGLPPVFSSYADYSSAIGGLVAAGAMPDETHAWWYVRPHPRFGTVEVRICDGQADVRRSAALAALVQATCAWIGGVVRDGGAPTFLTPSLLEENLWRATRDGLDATFIAGSSGEQIPARAAVERLVEHVAPCMSDLGSTEYVPVIERMVEQNEARTQLAAVDAGATLADVLGMNVEATARVAEAI